MPAFLKLPIRSFFFVSTDTTGSLRPRAARTVALMYWNCASRSAWLEPSSALRLPWREKPSFRSSVRTCIDPHREAHRRQRRGQLFQAFQYPNQRTHRIAESVRVDQSTQRLAQSRIFVAERVSAAALTADAPGRQRRRVQIVFAAIDRRARQPRNLGNQRQPAAPSRPNLRRREQPTPALVQLAPERLPSNLDPPPNQSCKAIYTADPS